MNIILHNDYVYTKELNLNLTDQRNSAHSMYNYIKVNFTPDPKTDYIGKSTLTTNLYQQYNYLMYPFPGLHELYNSIKETFHLINTKNTNFYIQCWLNFYRKGEFIDWHGHWHQDFQSWHGFYCVDVEPESYTTYRVFDRVEGEDDIIIPSKDNLLVITRSGDNSHRSSEWNNDKPRITVAFDIVPSNKLHERRWCEKNHWIPI
jgi:hypothetical protein